MLSTKLLCQVGLETQIRQGHFYKSISFQFSPSFAVGGPGHKLQKLKLESGTFDRTFQK
jgi:hypothetical protein